MLSKQFIKSAIGILWHNPILIKSLVQGNLDKIYCSYWHFKLKDAKRYHQELSENNNNGMKDFLKHIKDINYRILNKKSSRIEAFYIPLYLLIRKLKPDFVIETGVHRGVSSLFILEALEENGKGMLHSIDLPLASYDTDSRGPTKSLLPPEKIGICVPNKLRKRWNLILGDSTEQLPILLEKVPTVDFFLHDSKHTYSHMMWEFQKIWPRLKEGGLLLSDDTNWNDAFNRFANEVKCDAIHLKRDKETDETFGIIFKSLH